jgi:hypothetical protein
MIEFIIYIDWVDESCSYDGIDHKSELGYGVLSYDAQDVISNN